MTGCLVDISVLSELAKKAPAPAVVRWFENTAETLGLSTITVEEFLTGLLYLGSEKKLAFFSRMMRWECRVFPVTHAVAERSAQLRKAANAQGPPMGIADALIAATALEEGLVLVTRNVKGFCRCGVEILNPFE